MYFKFNISLPNNLIIRPIGVTTKKNIIPKIIGDIILPKSIPNLNQILFKGDKRLELRTPKTKNIKDTIKDQSIILLLFVNG